MCGRVNFADGYEDNYLAALKRFALMACNASSSCYTRGAESIRRFRSDLMWRRDEAMLAGNRSAYKSRELECHVMRLYSQSRKFLTCDETRAHSVAKYRSLLEQKAWLVLRALKELEDDPPRPSNVIMFPIKDCSTH